MYTHTSISAEPISRPTICITPASVPPVTTSADVVLATACSALGLGLGLGLKKEVNRRRPGDRLQHVCVCVLQVCVCCKQGAELKMQPAGATREKRSGAEGPAGGRST